LAVLPTYKAQRPPMPSDLRKQMPLVEEYLERARIPALRLEGEEADDLLATLARKAAGEGADVTIVTSDKDLLQIAGGTVWIVAPSKTATRVGREDVMAKLGVYPEQVVDWLALTGDSTDNVPGVPGVGPRTAARLLQDFGSLAEVWPRLDEVQPEKLRLALRQHRQRVEANQALLSLRHDLPCELDWAAMALAPEDAERVLPFYERLELRSLADEAREGRLL
jgi:DNA polymerase-1